MSHDPTNSEQLSAWLDGELDDAEAAAIERELERDARLRAELDELREVREMLRTHGPRKAPKSFHAKVMERVDQEPLPANNSVWLFLRRPFGVPIEALAVAAAALFVVLAGLSVGTSTLDAPFQDIDFGSRREKEPAKDEAAAPVAPTQEQTIDPSGGDGDDKGAQQQRLDEPKPKAVKKEPPVAKEEPKEAPPAETTASSTTTEPPQAAEGEADGGLGPRGTQSKSYEPEQVAPSGWSFMLVTADEDIVAALQAIAGKNGGELRDTNRVLVTTGTLEGGESGAFYIRVKASQLSRVVEQLQKTGAMPRSKATETFNAGQMVDVRVDVMLDISKSSEPAIIQKKAAPSSSTPPSGSSGSGSYRK